MAKNELAIKDIDSVGEVLNNLKDFITVAFGESGQIFISPDGESALLKVIEFDKLYEAFSKALRTELKEKMLEIDPNMKKLQSDQVSITISDSGSLYVAEDISKVAEEFLKKSLDSDKVKEYVLKNNCLPEGVSSNEARTKKITITKVKPKKSLVDDVDEIS